MLVGNTKFENNITYDNTFMFCPPNKMQAPGAGNNWEEETGEKAAELMHFSISALSPMFIE